MPQPDDLKQKIQELEENVRVLLIENDQLVERAEDTMLLGLIAERISGAEEIGQVLEAGLERISVLKDIPFCACCSLTGNQAVIVKSCLSFTDEDMSGRTIVLPETMMQKLAAGDCLLGIDECRQAGMSVELKTGSFVPLSLICIPFRSRFKEATLFFFADHRPENHLSDVADMLRRVTEMMTARMDNLSLFHALQDLNRELDRKVEERTRELQESEKKYRELFESIVDIFYQTDNKGSLLIVSPSVEKLLGYAPDEIIGELSGIFVDTEEQDQFLSLLREKGEVQDYEVSVRAKDGSVIFVSTNAQFYRDKHGHIVGVQGIARDVTKRKQAEEKVQHTLDSLRKAVAATIQVTVSVVETRDTYTAGHQVRVSALAGAIATEMELPQDKIDAIRMAGAIHDVGKVAVPAEILSRPTKLSDIEFSLIKEHSRSGYEILKAIEFPWPLAEIVYQHHERMDGSGYPRNLKGEDILMEARIIAVADVVESMSSHRPYRPALGINPALEEIENNKGILYDTGVADICLRLFRDKGYNLGSNLFS